VTDTAFPVNWLGIVKPFGRRPTHRVSDEIRDR